VSFHFGLPSPELLGRVRGWGAKVLSSATTVEEARWLEARGVDAVIAQGFEAGGHRGTFLSEDLDTQVGTLALVPQVVDAVKIPVLAAGGISDGRGLIAALALGAQGAVIGTRFIATPEAQAAPGYRDAIVRAHEDATVRTRSYTGKPARAIRTKRTDEWEAKASEIEPFPAQIVRSMQEGVMDYPGVAGTFDPERTFMPAGQGAGMIHDVRPAADVFRDIVREAEEIFARFAR
jgi:nitronate monooxygenase